MEWKKWQQGMFTMLFEKPRMGAFLFHMSIIIKYSCM
jgi:hypothetical protein